MPLAADMLRRGFAACTLLAGVTLSPDAGAGAWMRSEGELLLGMSLSLSSAEERWDKDRRLVGAGCTTRRRAADVQGEYGYSYYHTVFADAGITTKECAGEPGESGLSDLTVGIRGRIDPFRNGRSWEVALKLPVSGDDSDTSRPGNGEFGLELGVHFRLAPDPYANPVSAARDGIWSWGSGVRLWAGGLAHQGWAYGGWGRSLDDGPWSLSAQLDGALSFGGDRGADGREPANDYDKLSARIGLRRRIGPETSVSLEFSRDLWGRLTDRENTLKLGLSRLWR